MAYFSVFDARSCLPAPIFCAASAETVASIEDGTMKSALITFSTIPTAAASFKPRLFAITVIMINAIWIQPSWIATGIPIFKISPSTARLGMKSCLQSLMPSFFFFVMSKEIITLNVWASVVPSAAPAAPIWRTPINT